MKTMTVNDLENMESRSRANLVNALSGYKSPMLLGSGTKKSENLAIFSNIFHIGSNPPLIGIFFRPHAEKQSLQNIFDHQHFSLNFINEDQVKKAHQTAATYEPDVSEFEQVGFESIYYEESTAPFVKDSPLSIGLSLVEHIQIKANKTSILVSKINFIKSKKDLFEDNTFKLENHSDIAVKGLDSYFRVDELYRLAYAKPGETLKEI